MSELSRIAKHGSRTMRWIDRIPTHRRAGPQRGQRAWMFVDGVRYRYFTIVQCRVCQSPYRRLIEKATVASFGDFTHVARLLPEDSRIPTRRIREHFRRGHHPWAE